MLRKVLLATTLLITNSQAATWVPYAQSPTVTYEFEPTLVTKHYSNGKVIVVWTRRKEYNTTFITKYELHCGSKSYRILVDNRTNKTNSSAYQSINPQDTWKWAIPEIGRAHV